MSCTCVIHSVMQVIRCDLLPCDRFESSSWKNLMLCIVCARQSEIRDALRFKVFKVTRWCSLLFLKHALSSLSALRGTLNNLPFISHNHFNVCFTFAGQINLPFHIFQRDISLFNSPVKGGFNLNSYCIGLKLASCTFLGNLPSPPLHLWCYQWKMTGLNCL